MWWNKKFNKWVSICIENPLKTWHAARKYFKRPKCVIHFFSNPIYNCPYANLKHIAKILDIMSSDVMWKEKYGTSRHERSPYIWVCFFQTFGFSLNWHIYYEDEFGKKTNGDSYYWEYLIDSMHLGYSLKEFPLWIYTSKLYKKCVDYGDEEDKDTYKAMEMVIPIVSMSLNEKGVEKLKSLN